MTSDFEAQSEEIDGWGNVPRPDLVQVAEEHTEVTTTT